MRTREILTRMLLVVPILAGALVLAGPSPAAAAATCTNQIIGAVTINSELVVTAQSNCRLKGTTVRGGVTIETGGSLDSSDVEIRGAITGSGTGLFLLDDSVVRGGIAVTTIKPRDLRIEDSKIRGNITVTGGGPSEISIRFNAVEGALTVTNNDVSSEIIVSGNTIRTNLACSGNTPAPGNEGIANTVGGATSGQCAGL